MANEILAKAKDAKNDEFYTQYADIEKEVSAYVELNPDVFRNKTVLLPCDDPEWSNFTKFFAQNFTNFGLKKLISTSFAIESKNYQTDWQPTLFETENPNFNADLTKIRGKIFTLTHDTNQSGKVDMDDLEWNYLEGDGDFRSNEVKRLRNEADIIVTNPPFSLFREFLAWIMEAGKQFLIIGNMNAVSYKEVFPLIKGNKIWVGNGFNISLVFKTPYTNKLEANRKFVQAKGYNPDENFIKTPAVAWFTNMEHGRHHEPLQLMTMIDNIKFSTHKELRGHGYQKYENYDAIEIPFVDAIPSDYDGIMGVPRSFMDKYCPEQFEIIGTDAKGLAEDIGIKPIGENWVERYKNIGGTGHITANMCNVVYTDYEGIPKAPYARIFIRKKQ